MIVLYCSANATHIEWRIFIRKGGDSMSTIEMTADKIICTVEGNERKSIVTHTASVITLQSTSIKLSKKL